MRAEVGAHDVQERTCRQTFGLRGRPQTPVCFNLAVVRSWFFRSHAAMPNTRIDAIACETSPFRSWRVPLGWSRHEQAVGMWGEQPSGVCSQCRTAACRLRLGRLLNCWSSDDRTAGTCLERERSTTLARNHPMSAVALRSRRALARSTRYRRRRSSRSPASPNPASRRSQPRF
jgi:hypothetical protein